MIRYFSLLFSLFLIFIFRSPFAYSAPTYSGTIQQYTNGYISGLSNNGLITTSFDFGGGAFYSAQPGNTVSLGTFNSYNRLYSTGISGNGQVAIGHGGDTMNYTITEAYSWTASNGFVGLGFLSGGNSSQAYGISYDGSVIVGTGNSSNFVSEAFIWTSGTGMVGLGTLDGTGQSQANAVSGDGSIIVGSSNIGYNIEAFRWTTETGMVSISPGYSSNAYGISSDGSTIVGYLVNADGYDRAFRWTQTTGTLELGALDGDSSIARATNADGSVVVGSVNNSVAFRWTEPTGMQSLASVLTSTGVNMTGWQLQNASFINSDGSIIAGLGVLNGVYTSYIANLITGGVTAPQDLSQSIASVATSTQQVAAITSNQMGQSLFQARSLIASNSFISTSSAPSSLNNLSTTAGGPYRRIWQMYTTGSFGIGQNNDFGNHDLNGTIGIKADITPEFAFGGAVIGSTARSDMVFGGNSKVGAYGVSGIAAYAPINNGLRLYVSSFAAVLDLNIRRGYQNGAGLDSSQGDTNGFAYGVAGQVGWNAPVNNRYSIMPYTELRYSKTKTDAYTETGGAFAGSFSASAVDYTVGRIGVENNYQLTDRLNLTGRVAIAHRLSDEAGGLSANVSGISQNVAGAQVGDKTWGEIAGGAGFQLSERTYINGELNVRSGRTQEPLLTATVGLSVKF